MLPKTDSELLCLAYRSRETLRSRYKLVAREHADRIRKLDALMHQIGSKDPASQDAQLPGGIGRVSLSDDLAALVLNPTAGL